jgi:hypothetical protein
MRRDLMTDITPDAEERRIGDYLLGRLDAAQESAVEERYLADPEFHDRLLAVERDLIDQFVRGELPDADVFERRYLSSPSRRARVDFARALLQPGRPASLEAAPSGPSAAVPPGRSMPRWWLMAATVAIAVAGSLFAVNRWSRDQGGEPASTATGKPSPPPAQPPPVTTPPPGTAPAAIATILLLPNSTRGADPIPTLAASAGDDVRLELELETGGFAAYRVTVRTAGGAEIWRDDRLKAERSASGERLATTIPSQRVTSDDYTVRVQGLSEKGEGEELSGYAFRIRKR